MSDFLRDLEEGRLSPKLSATLLPRRTGSRTGNCRSAQPEQVVLASSVIPHATRRVSKISSGQAAEGWKGT